MQVHCTIHSSNSLFFVGKDACDGLRMHMPGVELIAAIYGVLGCSPLKSIVIILVVFTFVDISGCGRTRTRDFLEATGQAEPNIVRSSCRQHHANKMLVYQYLQYIFLCTNMKRFSSQIFR
jgi:hypothetical protein